MENDDVNLKKLKLQYEQNIIAVFEHLANIQKYETWLEEERQKLRLAGYQSRCTEEEIRTILEGKNK